MSENLEFYAGIYGLTRRVRRTRLEEVIVAAGLQPRRRQIAGTLSGGWKQRVALAAATIHRPPLLFLDEPTAGVDPLTRRAFWDDLHGLALGGTTIVVTTHYMDEAERCHRLAFIFAGGLLDVGRPDEIVERRHLRAAELDVADPERVRDLLAHHPEIQSIESYGHGLRIVTRDVDPVRLIDELPHPLHARPSPASVEDAFVAMVREAGEPS